MMFKHKYIFANVYLYLLFNLESSAIGISVKFYRSKDKLKKLLVLHQALDKAKLIKNSHSGKYLFLFLVICQQHRFLSTAQQF